MNKVLVFFIIAIAQPFFSENLDAMKDSSITHNYPTRSKFKKNPPKKSVKPKKAPARRKRKKTNKTNKKKVVQKIGDEKEDTRRGRSNKSEIFELFCWCWVLDCEEKFQDIYELKRHLKNDHAVCLTCVRKDALVKEINEHRNSSAHQEELKRYIDLPDDQEKKINHTCIFDGKLVCVMCAMSYCFDNKNVFKDHVKSGHNKKNGCFTLEHNSDSKDDCAELCCDEAGSHGSPIVVDCSDQEEESDCWNQETPVLTEDSSIAVLHTGSDYEFDSTDSSDYEDDIENQIFLSCWLEKCDTRLSEKKYCCEVLENQAAAIQHFQDMHNICCECMQKKAFFKSLETIDRGIEGLIAHQDRLHKGEVPRASKCLIFGHKKVCKLCLIEHCQYKSQKELEQHMQRNHQKNKY